MTRLEGFIDRFEREGAVISMADRSSACVARKVLPQNVQEGDFIVEDLDRHLLAVDPVISELHHREVRLMNDACFD